MRYGKLAVAVLTALVLAAACSSSGGTSGGTSGNPAGTGGAGTNSLAAKGTTITVGAICTCSGAYGTEDSDAGNLVKAWAKTVNTAGGLKGHPVDLKFYDDASNPATASTNAQKLVSAHVDVVMDLSIFDTAWAKTVSAANIPVVGGSFGTEPFYTDPNFYPAGQTTDSIAYSIASTAKLAGAKNIGVLYCSESPQCQATVPLVKNAGKKLGVPVTYSAAISLSQPNYTAQCVAAKQAHVEAIFIAQTSPAFYRLGPDCTRQNYSPIFIGEGQQFTMKEASTAGMSDKLWLPFTNIPYFVTDNPGIQKMNAAEDKYYPGMRKPDAYNELPAQTWAGLTLIETALSNAAPTKAVTASDVKSGLNSITNETLDGMAPPLTFTAGKPHSVSCWVTARVQNGKPQLVNGGKYTCQGHQ